MADLNHLYGSCACERNQYTVIIPSSSASLAHVFFDNSTACRRTQATPVTAWLRVPLNWYHSTTFAEFPDETHSSIRRTYYARPPNPLLPPTRKQFCGYCGTHLTAWNEGPNAAARAADADFVDVTLGSLLSESLDRLESLKMYTELDSDAEDAEHGLKRDPAATVNEEDHTPTRPQHQQQAGAPHSDAGMIPRPPHRSHTMSDGRVIDPKGTVNDEDHIRTGQEGLVRDPNATFNDEDHIHPSDGTTSSQISVTPYRPADRAAGPHNMQNRGVPYFEEMVENSRLGRIKRQMGGHTSADGMRSVQWEIVEIGGDEGELQEGEGATVDMAGNGSKRLKRA